MASLNKVLLMGNLTRDPELRYTPSGSAVCEFGLAVNRRTSYQGEQKDEPCFVDIIVWERQAEASGKHLQKGSSVFIEGRLQYDQWTDREQKKRSRLRVVAERVQFLGGRRDAQGGEGPDGNSQDDAPYRRRQVPQDDRYAPQGRPAAPRQAPAPQDDYDQSYEDPTRTAPPRRQGGNVPPPPVPGESDPRGIEDDIPF